MPTPAALILDFGGVLIRDDPEIYARFAQEHGLSASHFYSVVEASPHRPLLMVGAIHLDESGDVLPPSWHTGLAGDGPGAARGVVALRHPPTTQ